MNLQRRSSRGHPVLREMDTTMKRITWIGLAVAGLLWGGAARAGTDEDFAFASGLVSYSPSFPDFAQKVVDAVLAKDPSQKDRSKVIQAEILIQ